MDKCSALVKLTMGKMIEEHEKLALSQRLMTVTVAIIWIPNKLPCTGHFNGHFKPSFDRFWPDQTEWSFNQMVKEHREVAEKWPSRLISNFSLNCLTWKRENYKRLFIP